MLASVPFIVLFTLAVCILAAGSTVGLLVSFGVKSIPGAIIDLIPSVPYLILIAIAWGCRGSRYASLVVMVGSAAIAIYGVYNFFNVFVFSTNHNSTEALVILFIPVYQMPGVFITGVIGYLVKRLSGPS